MSINIGLVDYGTGNIASLQMALSDLGAYSIPIRNPQDFSSADAIILPGVGHFGPAVSSLQASGMLSTLSSLLNQGMPVLGICLGFQILTSSSEEAPGIEGLGLIPGTSLRLRPTNTRIHKVPHLGWNRVIPCGNTPRLLHGIPTDNQVFYFANAFGVSVTTFSETTYALYQHESPWVGLLEYNRIFGVQFHPEKSRSQGLMLLNNFLNVIKS